AFSAYYGHLGQDLGTAGSDVITTKLRLEAAATKGLLYRQDRVERRSGAAAYDRAEAGAAEQRFVFDERPFAAFRTRKHVEVLEVCPARTGLIVVEKLLGNEKCAAGGKLVEDLADELVDFRLAPVMQNSADCVDVCLG